MIDTFINDYPVVWKVAAIIGMTVSLALLVNLWVALRRKGLRQRVTTLKASAQQVVQDAQENPEPIHNLPLLVEQLRYHMRHALMAMGMLERYVALHVWWQGFKQVPPMPWLISQISTIHGWVNRLWAWGPFEFLRALYRTVKRWFGGLIQRGFLRLWKLFTSLVKNGRRLFLVVTGVGATPFLIGVLLLGFAIVAVLLTYAYIVRVRKRAEQGHESHGFVKELATGLKELFQAWAIYVTEEVVKPIQTGVVGPLLSKYTLQATFFNGLMTAIGTVTTLALAGWVHKELGMAIAVLLTLLLFERSLNFFQKFDARQEYKEQHGGKVRTAEEARQTLRVQRHIIWGRVMRDAALKPGDEGYAIITRKEVEQKLAERQAAFEAAQKHEERKKAWNKGNKTFFKTKRKILRSNRKVRRKMREARAQQAIA